jgi:hypothetical protein
LTPFPPLSLASRLFAAFPVSVLSLFVKHSSQRFDIGQGGGDSGMVESKEKQRRRFRSSLFHFFPPCIDASGHSRPSDTSCDGKRTSSPLPWTRFHRFSPPYEFGRSLLLLRQLSFQPATTSSCSSDSQGEQEQAGRRRTRRHRWFVLSVPFPPLFVTPVDVETTYLTLLSLTARRSSS